MQRYRRVISQRYGDELQPRCSWAFSRHMINLVETLLLNNASTRLIGLVECQARLRSSMAWVMDTPGCLSRCRRISDGEGTPLRPN